MTLEESSLYWGQIAKPDYIKGALGPFASGMLVCGLSVFSHLVFNPLKVWILHIYLNSHGKEIKLLSSTYVWNNLWGEWKYQWNRSCGLMYKGSWQDGLELFFFLWVWETKNSEGSHVYPHITWIYLNTPSISGKGRTLNVATKLFFFCLFRAASTAYGGAQARGWIRAIAASLYHSHSNMGSQPCLWPTPQLTAMWDP